jgi:hypothetical protein
MAGGVRTRRAVPIRRPSKRRCLAARVTKPAKGPGGKQASAPLRERQVLEPPAHLVVSGQRLQVFLEPQGGQHAQVRPERRAGVTCFDFVDSAARDSGAAGDRGGRKLPAQARQPDALTESGEHPLLLGEGDRRRAWHSAIMDNSPHEDAFIGLFDVNLKSLGSVLTWRSAGLAGGTLACMSLAFLTGLWVRTSSEALPARKRAPSYVERCAMWVFTPRERFQDHVAHATLTSAAAGVIGGISVLSGFYLLTFVLAGICFIPVVGFMGASAYAKAAVIAPPSCVSPVGVRLRAHTTTVGAPCVELIDPATGTSMVGRLILARGSRIFLYSKEEDRAYMFTMKDAAMKTVHVLPQDSQASGSKGVAQVQ